MTHLTSLPNKLNTAFSVLGVNAFEKVTAYKFIKKPAFMAGIMNKRTQNKKGLMVIPCC